MRACATERSCRRLPAVTYRVAPWAIRRFSPYLGGRGKSQESTQAQCWLPHSQRQRQNVGQHELSRHCMTSISGHRQAPKAHVSSQEAGTCTGARLSHTVTPGCHRLRRQAVPYVLEPQVLIRRERHFHSGCPRGLFLPLLAQAGQAWPLLLNGWQQGKVLLRVRKHEVRSSACVGP